MTKSDLACAQVQNLLFEYIEGEVSPEEKDAICRHLYECETCRQLAEEYCEALDMVGKLSALPPDIVSPVMQQLRMEQNAKKQRRSHRWIPYAVTVAAVVLVGVLLLTPSAWLRAPETVLPSSENAAYEADGSAIDGAQDVPESIEEGAAIPRASYEAQDTAAAQDAPAMEAAPMDEAPSEQGAAEGQVAVEISSDAADQIRTALSPLGEESGILLDDGAELQIMVTTENIGLLSEIEQLQDMAFVEGEVYYFQIL